MQKLIDDPSVTPATSALARVHELQQEIARLSAQARDEAIAQASQAVQILNALGLPYRLVDDTVRAPVRKRKQRSLDCHICGFTTDPPHNARKHKAQGDDARAFTDDELVTLGLRRSG